MRQVFVSYAHEDNTTVDPSHSGWVSYFYNALEVELKQRGILDLKLWRDAREIRPYEQFSDDIEDGLRNSQLLLSVLSPVYVQKEWCNTELDRFAELHGAQSREERECIIKVVKRAVPRDEEPSALTGQTGYKFYDVDADTRQEIPFYTPGRSIRDEFFDAVNSLANDLAKRLKNAEPRAAADEVPSRGTVFLAFTASALADEIRRVRGELEQLGYKVVPDQGSPPPTEIAELNRAMENWLKDATCAIFLFGETPGLTPDGSDKPLMQLQLDWAASEGVTRVLWAPPPLPTRNPVQAALIGALRDGKTLLEGDELIEEGFDRLKGFLLDLVDIPDKTASTSDPANVLAMLQSMTPEQREQFKALLDT